MNVSETFQFDRALREYATWRGATDAMRSPAPSWWWSSALALRDDPRPLPSDLAALADFGATYSETARRMLAAIGAQTSKPWPDEFPTKYSSHGSDEAAASAEPAAQAAHVAVGHIS